jgi:hypothetical protein
MECEETIFDINHGVALSQSRESSVHELENEDNNKSEDLADTELSQGLFYEEIQKIVSFIALC